MKLVVGLGNVGGRYKGTRHNVGFKVAEKLVVEWGTEDWKEEGKFWSLSTRKGDVVLVKPNTMMNESGKAVSKWVQFYKVGMDDLWIIHDDLDIVVGDYKIDKGKGQKIHNGVNDIEEKLGKDDFWRVRVGVDGREGKRDESGADYVLGRFSLRERQIVDEMVRRVVEEMTGRLGQ